MLTVKELLETANAMVPHVSVEEAKTLMAEGALVLDVRDAPEIAHSGKVEGAHHISRGMLEFRADPDCQFHDPELRRDRPVIVYCASGGRSALAGKLLKDMGYQEVYNLGGFAGWVEAGGAVRRSLDPGM
ncbi:rhodanese-like domain-containing protein [Phaeovulum vinaykumarii]|uniref:Rhodanese-related sulfurtransferase n=1 Tax=Phaeovulum vinaykumarii TaxID=407234 RepID=A0A1N7LGC4_9RHOB|nr:rhodanese-like domain-containing protein [Phaeovulum vinaykumarii]SIS72821.1 Rhodanese-related sulfurtransferase [Phaeovulum vinaykumarii]SOC04524.1 rhodanese-related sulfurtransferase [Phaeovulum vinaykumarii]